MTGSETRGTTPQQSLEELRPRLLSISNETLAARRRMAQGLDLERTASRVLELGRLVNEPALRRRFLALPLAEFNHANLDLLEPAAVAILHLTEQLGASPAPRVPTLQRELSGAWAILTETYAEVRAAARFIFRHDRELLERFGDLGDLG